MVSLERALEIFWHKSARDYAEQKDARLNIVVTESET
jgi:hypothetical protein